MVGMSGKSNEPRGGTSGSIQHSKKQQSVSGHSKNQVSLRGVTIEFFTFYTM